jgi:diguanylate cyclase
MQLSTQTEVNLRSKLSIKRELFLSFLLLFIPASMLLSSIFYAFSSLSHQYELQTILIREEAALDNANELTSLFFEQKLSDLLVLAEGETLRKFLQDESQKNWIHLSREFSLFARRKPKYSQIRFLDTHGMEVVRINNANGVQSIVPKRELQDKHGRYYFTDALKLAPGEIYISPLDLNVENGVIEEPIVPTIRMATPVVDGYGNKRGILIFNYSPVELLDRIADIFKSLLGETYILNKQGYWLMGLPQEKLWGFMYGSDETFAKQNPDVWTSMNRSEEGSFTSASGMYIFRKAYPLDRSRLGTPENILPDEGNTEPKQGDLYWFYLSYISNTLFDDLATKRATISSLTYLLLFLVTGAISYFFARNAVQKKIAFLMLQEHATTDDLTGVANRRELQKIGEREFQRAQRFERELSILMLDLDRFKRVNDNYGHNIGDAVLVHVTEICQAVMRTQDLLARYGGEEFSILLPETDIDGASLLAERICHSVRTQPYTRNGEGIHITLSIGVGSRKPEDNDYTQILIRADKALYEAKHQGRDRVVVLVDENGDNEASAS